MGAPHVSNIGAFIKTIAPTASRGVAAGAGDATEVTALTGTGNDRRGYGSAKLVIVGHAVNTATKKLQLSSVKLEQSDDGTTWDSPVEQLTANVDLAVGTGEAFGTYTLDVNLAAYKRYLRYRYTPDHTASGTDTFEVGAVLVLGGADVLPAA